MWILKSHRITTGLMLENHKEPVPTPSSTEPDGVSEMNVTKRGSKYTVG